MAGNFTNAFYIGVVPDVALILGRYSEYRSYESQWFTRGRHYEGIVTDAFIRHEVPHVGSKAHFFKIRATCSVSWQAPYGDRMRQRVHQLEKSTLERSLAGRTSCSCPEGDETPF